MKRIHVYYTGSVQGVGFRFAAERIASAPGLTGWVKNLGDGRVELVCEGRETALKEFLEKMNDIFKEYIRDSEVEWLDATGEFSTFNIAFA